MTPEFVEKEVTPPQGITGVDIEGAAPLTALPELRLNRPLDPMMEHAELTITGPPEPIIDEKSGEQTGWHFPGYVSKFKPAGVVEGEEKVAEMTEDTNKEAK